MNRGVYTYKDGSKYDGEWKGKKRHGYGVWVRSDGFRFEGYWENDKPNGYGTLTNPEGRKQAGKWKDGKFIGEAKPAINETDLINKLKIENQELKREIALLKEQIAESQELANQTKATPANDYQVSQSKKIETIEAKPARKKPKKLWIFALIALVLLLTIVAIIGGEENQLAGSNDFDESVGEEAVIDFEDKADDINNDLVENEGYSNDDEAISTTENQSQVPSGQIEVHFIDVGQGDSIYIATPEQRILIDGGDRGTTVVNYLQKQGVTSLDLVIGTHPHADHIGGLINVMQSIPVKEIIDPAVVHTTKTFEDYLDIIDQKDVKFTEGRAGMTKDLGGGALLSILHPTAPSSSSLNDASIVAKLTFGQISFLFTGDAEQAAERQMLARGENVNSSVLKVGHHGSRTSTTQAFLNAVDPQIAVIMCGRNNQYGHPHDETFNKLIAANVDIYRTDLQGTIVIITDGQTLEVKKADSSYAEQPMPPPEESTPPQIVEGQFLGSKNSDKYHYPDCHHASSIKPENIVWFSSIQEATAAGYVPCKGCNPPGNQNESASIQESAPQPAPAASSPQYVGSKNSEVFHNRSCHHVQSILSHNLREYESRDHAINAGKRPCKTCNP